MPQRIQRKRTKGWRMPEGVIYVGRPTIWGNPFDDADSFRYVLDCILRKERVSAFVECNERCYRDMQAIANNLGFLRGRDVACWCSLSDKCHADVLVEFANREVNGASRDSACEMDDSPRSSDRFTNRSRVV